MTDLPPNPALGTDPRISGGRVTIDLPALAANYRLLCRTAAPARVAGVVKANAYGLGIDVVAPVLWREGCRTFFVALPSEGVALRQILPDAEIYVLAGLFGPESAGAYREAELLPVLNDLADISLWEAFGWDGETAPRPCAIHVDTGMNRLGLTPDQALAFLSENAITGALSPRLVMSHLACGDETRSPMNAEQLHRFQAVASRFSGVESSLANSAGLFLDPAFHFDLVRPGIALYGGRPSDGPAANPMRPVVTVEARVVQVREVPAGGVVSYGGTHSLTRDSRVAVVAAGYADGLHRALSGAGVPLREPVAAGGEAWVQGRRVPIVGRVTMDLTLLDVTELGADAVGHGDHVEFFGHNIPLDEAAAAAGTISYELLTSIGRRYHRRVLRSHQDAVE